MGIYKRVTKTCGDSTDLYASVREDGNKAIVHSPFGTKVYTKVDKNETDNDLLMKIRSNPDSSIRDLIPFIDALGDYIFLTNKPQINGITLEGNLSTEDLKIFGRVSASGVYFEDGESIQEKYDKGEFGASGTKDYEALTNKPSINGITLTGDLTTAQLGVIEDESITDVSTWSSKYIQQKLNNVSVVKELVGTDAEPIIASELMLGAYIISGKVQSSRYNVTTIRVPRKQYMVNRDVEGTTVIWDSNPYTASHYYVVFKHTGVEAPQTNTVEIITKAELEKASLDCGEF